MNVTNLTEEIASQLEKLAEVADDSGMKSLSSEIRDERIPALRDRRMSMVVLGEFNHGKSSTINALLGTEVLPTGITPTTSVITHLVGGDGTPRVRIGDETKELSREELHHMIVNEPPNDLEYVEIPVDAPLLSDGLFIVDTPGVNDISNQKVEITYGYVPRADVVVYVLDATQALKRSEISFIRDRLIKNSLDRLFFVIGKVDALSESELEEVVSHVKERLEELVGTVPLFPVSARNAMRGEDEGFSIFKSALDEYVSSQRDAIVLEGALRTGLRMTGLLDQSLAIEFGALRLESTELEKRIGAVKEKLARSRMMVSENMELIDRQTRDVAAAVKDNVRTFTREFGDALPLEIERARPDDIKRYLPAFIHDTFKDFVEAEGTQLALRLEALAEEIIAITNRNMREVMDEVQEELGVPARDIDLEVDTFALDVGVFALGALGVSFLAFSNMLIGGVLTLSAPVLAFVLKDRVETAIRKRATEQGSAAIERAGEKVELEFGRIIDEFSERLKEFVESAGDRLYRQVAEALDRALSDRKEHEGNRTPVEGDIAARRARVMAIRTHLLGLRDEAGGSTPNVEGAERSN